MDLEDRIALWLLGVLLLTMPLFAVVRRGREVDPEVTKRPKTIILGTFVRDWLMWVIGPMERGALRLGLSPDLFNFLGVAFGAAAGVAYVYDRLSLAGWLVLLGGAADIFDGRIARARGIASEYGAFMDSTLDRFAETFAFMGLALYYGAREWAVLATATALGGSLLVSYTRARGEALGVSQKGGVMQRAERLVLLALASLLDAPVGTRLGRPAGTVLAWTAALIGVGALGTAIYRTVTIGRELRDREGRK